jgi:hypothetical protein
MSDKTPRIGSHPNMPTVEELASDWDYKPWEDDLSPQDYASYGFIQGYLRAKEDLGEIDVDSDTK